MPIFGIHPADKDLNFFKKVNENFEKEFHLEYVYLRLEADHRSHESCINTLMGRKDGTLFFFCHALERSIRGCNIEHSASSLSYKDFSYGPLISPERNIKIFDGKKIFCLACFSKDLGKYAIGAGAKVYLGFGDIPFYIREKFKESTIEAAVKRELSIIISNSLGLFIKNNWTFNQLSSFLQLIIDKRRIELLTDKSSGLKIRVEVSNVLSRIKSGITMFGNGELTIRD